MNKKNNDQKFPVRLANAEEMNAKHPETFWIYDRWVRESVVTGDVVKLVFVTDDPELNGERMWVTICECLPGETYIGKLHNTPLSLPLTQGIWVRFRPEHILDIED